MNSVDPNNPTAQLQAGANGPSGPDLSSKQFSTCGGGPSSVPIPSSNPITQTPESVGLSQLAATTAKGDQELSQATAQSRSSGGKGGGGIGGIIGGIGSAIGSIFAEGGYVGHYMNGGFIANKGYAEGGPTDDISNMWLTHPDIAKATDEELKKRGSFIGEPGLPRPQAKPGDKSWYPEGGPENMPTENMRSPEGYIEPPSPSSNNLDVSSLSPQMQQVLGHTLGIGYLIGALHQGQFGGSPDTLHQAANVIKDKLMQPTPMAGGGEVNADKNLAQDALMKALGLTNDSTNSPTTSASTPSEDQSAAPNAAGNQVNTQTANAMLAGSMGQANPGQVSQAMQSGTQLQNPGAVAQGYVQKFAPGGMPMPENGGGQPPLKPGQPFEGDGSVKGPGGPTDDAIPARLSNGEFVMSAPAVQFFGVDKLTKMNEQGKQGFMQAMQQVQDNQAQGPGAAMPQQPPQGAVAPASMPPAGPSMQQPMMQKNGGFANKPKNDSPTMRNKTTGFAGI